MRDDRTAPGFSIGQRVRAKRAPIGVDHDDIEHELAVGAEGHVDLIEGGRVHVVYPVRLADEGGCIVNTYSAADGDLGDIEIIG